MLAISMMGVTHSAEIVTFSEEKEFPPLTREARWVDLPGYLSEGIARNAEIYIVKRFNTQMGQLTWIGLYRHAVGIGLKRPGSYHGAGVWLQNTIAKSETIVALLPLIANQIKALAMDGDHFHCSLEQIAGKVNFPQEVVNSIARSFVPVPPHGGVNGGADDEFFVDISDPQDIHTVARYIDLALAGAGFSAFNRISIGNDRDMALALASKDWPVVRKPAKPAHPLCLPGKQALPGPLDPKRRVQRLRGLVAALKSERSALTNENARLKLHIEMRQASEDRSAAAPEIMLDAERFWSEMAQWRQLMQAVLDEQGSARPSAAGIDAPGLQVHGADGGKSPAHGATWRTGLVWMYCIVSLLLFAALGAGWTQGWYAGNGALLEQLRGAPAPRVKIKEELIEIEMRAVEILRARRSA